MCRMMILLLFVCALPLVASSVHLSISLRTAEDAPRAQKTVVVSADKQRKTLLTDANGICRTQVPEGTVTITVGETIYKVVTAAGAPNAFTLVPEWREVTQTGVPAGTVLHGSYAWRGALRFLHVVADGTGTARWPSVPLVSVVVWGDGVNPGVLAADVDTVTKPLPTPREDTTVVIAFLFPDIMQRINISFCVNGGYPLDGHYNADEVKAAGPDYAHKEQLRCGAPFSLLVLTKTTPMRIAWLDTVYAPIVDKPGLITYTLPTEEISTLHLRFETIKHQPLPGVSQLKVCPAHPKLLPEILQGTTARNFGFFTPMLEKDGRYTVLVPTSAALSLFVDCFDATMPLPPALEVSAEPGETTQTVTLPPPLLQIPAKTVLTWVTRNSPSAARWLTAADTAGTVAIFGSPEETIACWYLPDPEHLVIWKGDAPHNSTTFNRRSVLVAPIDDAGKPRSGTYPSYYHLYPLLPMAPASWGHSIQPELGSEATNTPLPAGKTVSLWTAPYTMTNGWNGLFTLTVPAGPEPEVTLSPVIASITRGKYPPPVRWHFPHLDYVALSKTAAPAFSFRYDTPLAEILSRTATVSEKNLPLEEVKDGNVLPDLDLTFPASAKTVTFSWLGVGEIRDVPIPRDGKARIDVTLPPWDPCAIVRGQLLADDGKPLANKYCWAYSDRHPYNEDMVNSGMFQTNVSFTTDVDGRFSVQGVPSGQLLIGCDEGGWVVDVPARGVKEVVLAKTLHPFEVRFDTITHAKIWWLPDQGAPRRLFAYDNRTTDFDWPRTSGWLWAHVDNGRAYLVRYLIAERGLLPKELPTGPPLGLYLPLDPRLSLPDSVELIGQGSLAGLHANFAHLYWQPVPLLSAFVGEITSVPPGDYQVKVATNLGVLTATVNVGDTGGKVWFAMPK